MKHACALFVFFASIAVCAHAGYVIQNNFGLAWAITFVFGVPAIGVLAFYWLARDL